MKTLVTLFSVLLVSMTAIAQAPQRMNYQAIVRDNTNVVVANQLITVRVYINHDTPSNVGNVYCEQHQVMSNEYGLISFMIGDGFGLSGTYDDIQWGIGTYWLGTSMDPTGGTNFTMSNTQQLVSVPFSYFADVADHAINDLDNQQFSVSQTGDTLHISNGNYVIIPGISAANQ